MEKIHPFYLARLSIRLTFSTTVALSVQPTACLPNINALGGAPI